MILEFIADDGQGAIFFRTGVQRDLAVDGGTGSQSLGGIDQGGLGADGQGLVGDVAEIGELRQGDGTGDIDCAVSLGMASRAKN